MDAPPGDARRCAQSMESISLVLGCAPAKKLVFDCADSYRYSVVSGRQRGLTQPADNSLSPAC